MDASGSTWRCENAFYFILNRTDVRKCTHQCDETQENNSTRALSTKIVFFECQKRDKMKEAKKRTNKNQFCVQDFMCHVWPICSFIHLQAFGAVNVHYTLCARFYVPFMSSPFIHLTVANKVPTHSL